ncbi:restriction endonuclease subunit S [Bacillus sp. S/N-304-OC-R1]|uniref:restriction endonuclease subunit S n=1 Tax=Bacillus sp. S/N-304-OC-R1 TaxID=2758034 RepID=UPI001C8F1A97|nr:restriction endonuclease subunit S [Bacillus sp. S/N-304-OC-R1]MBY0124406.1 restriction endonuclease subunit S [Bacillus sp. S/N-304-OC-R1]
MMREEWAEADLGDVCDIYSGTGFPKQYQGLKEGKYPFYKVGDISKNVQSGFQRLSLCDNYIEEETLSIIKGNILPSNCIVFAKIGEALKLNRRAITSTDCLVDNNVIGIKSKTSYISTMYLFYFFLQIRLEDYSRATTVPSVRKTDIENIVFFLPPLPEQRAIVNKMEKLFSELDNGIANLNKAKEKLKIYRQAVLKVAFEGELTKEWRIKQEDILNEFSYVTLKEIADVATGATPKKGNFSYWNEGRIPWVTSGALNNIFVKEASDFITEQALKETNCKVFPRGTLLIAMYGEGKTRGKCSELSIDAATNQAIAAVLIKKEYQESKKYLKWFFIKNYNDIRMLSSGGVQPNLNLTKIKETKIPFPKIQEQNEIVKELETRLSICENILTNIDEGLEKAESLRQSILKKAFEGRLLSEDELESCKRERDWDPAEQLLEKIKNWNEEVNYE